MTRQEIYNLLKLKGKRPSTIARSLGLSRSMITQGMDGLGSKRVRLKIAQIIDRPPSQIWLNLSRKQSLLEDDIYYHPDFYDLDKN